MLELTIWIIAGSVGYLVAINARHIDDDGHYYNRTNLRKLANTIETLDGM